MKNTKQRCFRFQVECVTFCILEAETEGKSEGKEKGFGPKFIRPLSDQQAVCGVPATLTVEISGDPVPDVCWTVDGEEIFEDEGIIFSHEGQVHSLIFKETVEEDEGLYKCIARNSHGEIECSARFLIADEAVSPEFVQAMEHAEVQEKCEAKFQVEVSGSPEPSIKWLKRKIEVVESEKYKIVKDGMKASLLILDCAEDDVGVYQAVAENSAGKASCNAQLTVIQKAEPPVIEAPENLPTKLNLKSGERFSLEFAVHGKVTDKSWMLNGRELESNDRIKVIYEKEKVILVIELVEESDGGIYEFVASNASGKVVNTITLNVEREFGISRIFFRGILALILARFCF